MEFGALQKVLSLTMKHHYETPEANIKKTRIMLTLDFYSKDNLFILL